MTTFEERHPGLKGKPVNTTEVDDVEAMRKYDEHLMKTRGFHAVWTGGQPRKITNWRTEEDIDATQLDKDVVRVIILQLAAKIGRQQSRDDAVMVPVNVVLEALGL